MRSAIGYIIVMKATIENIAATFGVSTDRVERIAQENNINSPEDKDLLFDLVLDEVEDEIMEQYDMRDYA